MSYVRSMTGALVAAFVLALPAVAQERKLEIGAHGGGFNALTSLNSPATADFKKIGYHVGGGVGVHFNEYVALKGEFTYARNELSVNDLATGTDVNRFFYSAAVQLQYPTKSGIAPYVYAGGGAVTIHQLNTSGIDKTKPAGTFGLGFNYEVPRSSVGLFLEGIGWVYQMSDMAGTLAPYDRTQLEIGWCAGISYHFPI